MSTMKDWPVIRLTQSQLDGLPEYSCSIPTGTTIGKRWKRDVNAYPRGYGPHPPPYWIVCEYAEHPTDPENKVAIIYKRIIITKHP